MAKKITERTSLKKGDIVRYPSGDEFFVGIVVRREKFLGRDGFYAFRRHPDDETDKELKKEGVDLYQRLHIKDLARITAELIEPAELMLMYRNAQTTIASLKYELVPCQNDTLENCLKKRGQLIEKIKKYDEKIDEIRGDTLVTI
ncbi:MAG: hypothetical protein Q7S12_00240 [bacterium]|nr:hypothetical protein [bacterium]